MRIYQDGVISPFSIESIKANFDRTLGISDMGQYQFQLDNAAVTISLKIDPYRTGSKAVINCNISNMKPTNNFINVSKIIVEVEQYLKNIVNS